MLINLNHQTCLYFGSKQFSFLSKGTSLQVISLCSLEPFSRVEKNTIGLKISKCEIYQGSTKFGKSQLLVFGHNIQVTNIKQILVDTKLFKVFLRIDLLY